MYVAWLPHVKEPARFAQIQFGTTCFECSLIESDDGCFSSWCGTGIWGTVLFRLIPCAWGVGVFSLWKNNQAVAEFCVLHGGARVLERNSVISGFLYVILCSVFVFRIQITMGKMTNNFPSLDSFGFGFCT